MKGISLCHCCRICRLPIAWIALALCACERPREAAHGGAHEVSEDRSRDSVNAQMKNYLDALFESRFDKFEAVDLPLREVLTKIESKFNSIWAPPGGRILKITTGSLADDRVTIVLRNIKVKTLFDLVAEQAICEYRVDYDKQEVTFFGITDEIGTKGSDPSAQPRDEDCVLPLLPE